MSDEAITEMPAMEPGPVGPGSFPQRKDDGLFEAEAHPYARAK